MTRAYIMVLVYNLFWGLTILRIVYGQPGFISLDCGGEESYNDTHSIQWTSVKQYIEAGEKGTIQPANINQHVERPLRQLRFFTYGKRNCYTLPAVTRNMYIIRASFLYGNFDGRQSQPESDLLIDANYWDTVAIVYKGDIIMKEVIVKARSSSISVYVVRTGDDNDNTTTFISSLELRPLMPSMYSLEGVGETYSLMSVVRLDFGLLSTSSLRYPEDEFDRIWTPSVSQTLSEANTTANIPSEVYFATPSAVMQTVLFSNVSNLSVALKWIVDQTSDYLSVLCFSEIEKQPPNTIREFNVIRDNDSSPVETITFPIYPHQIIFFELLKSHPAGYINYTLQLTKRSTLGPLVNVWEIYRYSGPLKNGTYTEDAAAIADIATSFNLKKDWTGDACLPQKYSWDWVVCNEDSSPRIIQVILPGKNLSGTIPLSFGSLSALVNLDLGRNNLNGSIPDALGQLSKLKNLNLSNNKLRGNVPSALIDKQRNGKLVLSISGNENICQTGACEDTTKGTVRKTLVISLVTVGCFALAAIATTIIFIKNKSIKGERKPLDLELVNVDGSRSFSYEEVRIMTEGFQKEIGKGGYGPVFHGVFQDKEVAVKILSEKSHQGATEFSTEVDILFKLHHKNLVKFFGYCTEKQNMILIYEYMSNGDLRHLLDGKISSGDADNWERRLSIARDAAQGTEDWSICIWAARLPLFTRDIESCNILLNDQMEANIADFGLSKMGPLDGATHVSTIVKGTTGYLDPDFGIVLMEIISGRRPVFVNPSAGQEVHIASWIREAASKGDIELIIDPSLVEGHNSDAMWKMAELAIACTSSQSMNRPPMSEVVLELREAMRLQTSFYIEMELSEKGSPAQLLPPSVYSFDKFESDTSFYPVAR